MKVYVATIIIMPCIINFYYIYTSIVARAHAQAPGIVAIILYPIATTESIVAIIVVDTKLPDLEI